MILLLFCIILYEKTCHVLEVYWETCKEIKRSNEFTWTFASFFMHSNKFINTKSFRIIQYVQLLPDQYPIIKKYTIKCIITQSQNKSLPRNVYGLHDSRLLNLKTKRGKNLIRRFLSPCLYYTYVHTYTHIRNIDEPQ